MSGPNGNKIAKARRHTDIDGTHEEGLLWDAPLPDPGTLRDYESLLPGMAQKILDMSEKEQSFRHKNSEANDMTMRKAIRIDSFTRFSIPIFSFIISFLMIGVAYYTFTIKLEWAGSILSLSSLAGIIYSFSRMMGPRTIGTPTEDSNKKQDSIKKRNT